MRIAGAALALLVLAGPVAGAVRVDLDRDRVGVGEPVGLHVAVIDARGSVGDPSFDVSPRGLVVQPAGTERSMSWVNGASSSQIVFNYELTAQAAGTYRISNLRVSVGGQTWMGPALGLVAVAGVTPAVLRMDLIPAEPYVGQPVFLRLRLIEHQTLEDWTPYAPENLTGFWAEPEGRPGTTRVEPGSPLRVVETRRRLYPLAAGRVTIGSANALLTVGEGPSGGFGGHTGPRQVSVESGALAVRVRPLPPGAPPDFGGAVGTLTPLWTCDRDRTPADVPLTLTLELRGLANLPLLHAPDLHPSGWEALPGGVEDSLAVAGTDGPALRRFHWTLVPRSLGRVEIPLPDVTWFDPGSGAYKRVGFDPIVIQVDPATGGAGSEDSPYPAAFASPLDPFARGWRPWAAALAGLAAGGTVVMARRGRSVDPRLATRRERDARLATVERPGGDFWRAALDACAWLEAHGRPQPELRASIASARYGSERTEAQPIRGRLRAELSAAVPGGGRRIPPGAIAVGLAVVAVAAGAAALPGGMDATGAAFARSADDRARAGDLNAARDTWLALWNRGARAPGLAARLAWSELRAGQTGRASAWVMRGAPGEARDPALEWTWLRIRESGGLLGTHPPRPALRSLELALAGFALGLAGAMTLGRRALSGLLLTLAAVAALALPVRAWMWSHQSRAVVLESVTLGDQSLELEPGQVVSVVARGPGRLEVRVGHEGAGWLPVRALEEIQ